MLSYEGQQRATALKLPLFECQALQGGDALFHAAAQLQVKPSYFEFGHDGPRYNALAGALASEGRFELLKWAHGCGCPVDAGTFARVSWSRRKVGRCRLTPC